MQRPFSLCLSKANSIQLLPFVFDMPAESAGAAETTRASALQIRRPHQIIPSFPPESETSNRDNYVNRLTNAQIMMRWAILCLLSVIIHPGDDTVHREGAFDASPYSAYGREIHNSSEMILITFSKCAQIKVGVSAVTQQRLLLKFKIHMDTRQADKACLISYPFGPKAASLWGMLMLRKPCHLSKAISGWGVCATYHCYTVNIKDALQTHSLLSCKS